MSGRRSTTRSTGLLLLVYFFVLVGLLGVLVIGPPATPGTLRCTHQERTEIRLPPVPVAAGEGPAGLIAAANKLAVRGRLDAAQRLYDRALALDTPERRAGLGLAYVQARRALAVDLAGAGRRTLAAGHEAEATYCFRLALGADRGNQAARDALLSLREPDTRSLTQQLADDWDAFYQRWSAPAARAALPFLVALTVLVVLARLITPAVVPGSALAWNDTWRALAWWTGLALLTVAALRTTAFAGRGPSKAEAWSPPAWSASAWRTAVVVVLLALAALVVHRSRRSTRREWLTLGWFVLGLAVAGTAAGIVAQRAAGIPDSLWPWVLAATLAVLGLVLIAAGRGHVLRLQVTVRKGETADPAATAYVLARLHDLGTSPPEGLKAPQQMDVTNLPADALTGLPVGKVAAALAATLAVLRPSVPWQATVADPGDDRMIVTLTRNGDVVRTAIVDGERFRDPSTVVAAGAGTGTTREPHNLLTAAAAVILTELAVRHPQLGRGLCGATEWDSVAAHVVATRPTTQSEDGGFRRRLLAFAVQRDPLNALARAAQVQGMGEGGSSRSDFLRQAERLRGLLATIEQQRNEPVDPVTGEPERPGRLSDDDGYLPLRLRTYHAYTAAWLNAAVSEGGEPNDIDQARKAHQTFRDLLEVCRDERGYDTFVRELQAVADEMGDALQVIDPDRTDSGYPGWRTWWRPRSMRALYDRACALAVDAERVPGVEQIVRDQRRELALEDLRLAADLPGLKEQAEQDPWLRSLRRPRDPGDPVPATFALIVRTATSTSTGPPPPAGG